MIQGSLPHRYARALISLAEQEGQLDGVRKELESIRSVLRQLPLLSAYMADIIVPARDRKQVLTEILAKMEASDLLRRFVYLLLAKERFEHFADIVQAYNELCDEIEGVLRAKVITTSELDKPSSERIEKLLADKTGKKVIVQYSKDPSLIGGIIIQVGNRLFDGSVQGDLNRVQEEMLR